ncbi:MAG: hypothetical protein KC656_14280 [Myxococcales bacterium]|nr:hypothetical protein [Myxococcales bacterium]
MGFIGKLDASLAVTRPLWHWLGQVALVVLGAHLAADHLDGAIGRFLADVPVAWPDTSTPFTVGLWTAVALELLVTIWAVRTLSRTAEHRVAGVKDWASRWSVHNLAGPVFWLPVSLAGSWVIAMAVEDLFPLEQAAHVVGTLVGLLVAFRLAGTGFLQLVLNAPVPKRRVEGWVYVLPLALVGWFAARYGLPIWGWLP